MRRRTVVRRTAAIGVAAVAGCMGGEPTAGTSTDVPVSIKGDPRFTVHDRSGGDGEETATVVFDAEKPAVTVEGIIVGKNGCMTAVLESAEYGTTDDELVITVGTRHVTDAGERLCTQPLVDISYTAGVAFNNGLPGAVEVIHQSQGGTRTVTTNKSPS